MVEPVEVLLKKAKGKIKLELNEIKNGFLHGRHPSMGDLKIPLEVIRKIEGGISLKKTEEFLNLLNQAHNALEENNPQKALSILQRIKKGDLAEMEANGHAMQKPHVGGNLKFRSLSRSRSG